MRGFTPLEVSHPEVAVATPAKREGGLLTGFTLIELVIVIGIVGLLTGILIVSFASSRIRFTLLMERVHVVEALLRAKNLAIQTFIPEKETVCGWGVHFFYDQVGDGKGLYFIYKDKIDANANPPEPESDCVCEPVGTHVCEGYKGVLDGGFDEPYAPFIFRLPSSLEFTKEKSDGSGDLDDPRALLDDVIFVPPNPAVQLYPDPDLTGGDDDRAESVVRIKTKGGNPEYLDIYIGKEGAVSLVPRQI